MILETYTYDDLLMVPQYSSIESRKDVSTLVKLGPYTYTHPLLCANMKSVISSTMAREVVKSGGLTLLHRFCTNEEIKTMYTNSSPHSTIAPYNVGISLGVNKESYETFWDIYLYAKPVIFCIDIANGDNSLCIKMIQFLKDRDPHLFVIAGNIATGPAAKRLFDAGADAVKVGIGGGSSCDTRRQTGHGIPMMSSLMEVQDFRKTYHPDKYIIADGGIKSAGDIVKALCYSDLVMVGNLFARCIEAPGETKEIDGKMYKRYEGSSTHKSKHIEGVKGWVPVSGTYQEVLEGLLDGVRSGCSYAGVNDIKLLQDEPQFVKITNSGLTESLPHDIILDHG